MHLGKFLRNDTEKWGRKAVPKNAGEDEAGWHIPVTLKLKTKN